MEAFFVDLMIFFSWIISIIELATIALVHFVFIYLIYAFGFALKDYISHLTDIEEEPIENSKMDSTDHYVLINENPTDGFVKKFADHVADALLIPEIKDLKEDGLNGKTELKDMCHSNASNLQNHEHCPDNSLTANSEVLIPSTEVKDIDDSNL